MLPQHLRVHLQLRRIPIPRFMIEIHIMINPKGRKGENRTRKRHSRQVDHRHLCCINQSINISKQSSQPPPVREYGKKKAAKRELTSDPVSHSSLRMSGVHTTSVNPARKKQTEYDKNINGHCQINTIFHRGLHSPPFPLESASSHNTAAPVVERDPRFARSRFTCVSINGSKRRTTA